MGAVDGGCFSEFRPWKLWEVQKPQPAPLFPPPHRRWAPWARTGDSETGKPQPASDGLVA